MKNLPIRISALALCAAFTLSACGARLLSPKDTAPSASNSSGSSRVSTAASHAAQSLAVSLGNRTVQVKTGDVPLFTAKSDDQLPDLSTAPTGTTYNVLYDATPVFEGNADEQFIPACNGLFRYIVKVPNEDTYLFDMDCDFPAKLTAAASIKQGETLRICISHAEGIELTAQSDIGFVPQFFSNATPDHTKEQIALLPIRYTASPGVYTVTVQAGGQTLTHSFTVQQQDFDVQYMTMPQSTAAETALSAQANAEWNEKIEPLKLISDPAQYWENPFQQPTFGPISTQFGSIRYTNDDPTPTRHNGTDIAAARGSVVSAANNGRVLFAGYLQLTGNTVIIEHGFGLKSWYYHMDSLNVKTGDTVKKGDQIGAVGSTGYSTGPHLHFALSVNNVFVNPWTAVNDGI
ncbi:M23 family metallopeptidase [Anaerotruncus colihominis]|uniref:M23 family metallopeptidase n=1 Tax=Anaerotruncus colihominis TaxID=169435 RepID=UPI0024335BBA|nr:M23 family metallopeptidase [Anaerotruncus colihominis]